MKNLKEIEKIEKILNNLLYSKSLLIFSPYGYNLMRYNIFVGKYDKNLVILNFELYSRKENKEIEFEIIYDYTEGLSINNLVLRFYEYDSKDNMLFNIERFYKAVLSDNNISNNLEYYLFLNNENELN